MMADNIAVWMSVARILQFMDFVLQDLLNERAEHREWRIIDVKTLSKINVAAVDKALHELPPKL